MPKAFGLLPYACAALVLATGPAAHGQESEVQSASTTINIPPPPPIPINESRLVPNYPAAKSEDKSTVLDGYEVIPDVEIADILSDVETCLAVISSDEEPDLAPLVDHSWRWEKPENFEEQGRFVQTARYSKDNRMIALRDYNPSISCRVAATVHKSKKVKLLIQQLEQKLGAVPIRQMPQMSPLETLLSDKHAEGHFVSGNHVISVYSFQRLSSEFKHGTKPRSFKMILAEAMPIPAAYRTSQTHDLAN